MPILDLQDVADDTVGGLALDEVLPGHLEVKCIRHPKLIDVVLVQWTPIGLTHLVPTDGIGNHFNDTTHIKSVSCSIGDGFVGEYVEI